MDSNKEHRFNYDPKTKKANSGLARVFSPGTETVNTNDISTQHAARPSSNKLPNSRPAQSAITIPTPSLPLQTQKYRPAKPLVHLDNISRSKTYTNKTNTLKPNIQTSNHPTRNRNASVRSTNNQTKSQAIINKPSKNLNKRPANHTVRKPAPPLEPVAYERPNPVGRNEAPNWLKDIFKLAIFVSVTLIGAWAINAFVLQSFNVVGPSMEPTLEGQGTHDRLIVNRVPITMSKMSGSKYIPERGEIIVFKNPLHDKDASDEFIVKRVIGLPSERVAIDNCILKVYNSRHPKGYNPYPNFKDLGKDDEKINTCVDGDGTDVVVPEDSIFVVGDHRVDNYSMDSRNGDGRASLGTIPLDDVVGPVSMRIWPFDKFKLF